jgi:hypothetical protein
MAVMIFRIFPVFDANRLKHLAVSRSRQSRGPAMLGGGQGIG